jgi:hypothetical protein
MLPPNKTTSYLAICKQTDDQLGEGAACAALAQCYQATGKSQQAVQYLEFFLDIGTPSVHTCTSLQRVFSYCYHVDIDHRVMGPLDICMRFNASLSFHVCIALSVLQPLGIRKCSSKQRRVAN